MRQDPDVTMIVEMRDFQSIQNTLMVAESGVLVLPTWRHVHGQSALATPVLRATGATMTDSPDVVGVITRCHSQVLLPMVNGGIELRAKF